MAAVLAYLPVSFMIFSLKNDIIAIEYPIQHFMSESLRNGIFPSWFDSWSMGFPLQSILTWGVYSTPQMLTGFLFKSNIYILNAEFLLYIIFSGCCMYKLLKTHFIDDTALSLLLSLCYMLSGFTVGSSQWLLYITGMTFIPVVLYFLLSLLKRPSFKYSLLLAISFFLFFTNVHIYLTVTGSYTLLIFLFIHLFKLYRDKLKKKKEKNKNLNYLLLSFVLTLVLCAAPAYYTFEVITYLARSQPLPYETLFSQSNYLHPDGLSSLLLPLSTIKTTHPNTEGIVLDTYMGLLPLLIFPVTLFINLNQKNKLSWIILLASLVFLFISFGHLTPVRGWINILPGMGNFRHPGVLRIFFIFLFILYLASSLKNFTLADLFQKGSMERKVIRLTIISLMVICLISFILFANNLQGLWQGSAYGTIKNINDRELTTITSAIQFLFLGLLFWSIYKKSSAVSIIIITELVLNTLICTTFFTISSFTTKEVNTILKGKEGYPVQTKLPQQVLNITTDYKGNIWPNINTYNKEISNHILMSGPLVIEKLSLFLSDDSNRNSIADKPVAYINDTIAHSSLYSYKVEIQQPGKILVQTSMNSTKEIIIQQTKFPGWKAYFNDIEMKMSKNSTPFISALVPAGDGRLMFKFEKPGVLYSSLFLHFIVLLTISFYLVQRFRIKLSSLS